MIVYDRVTLLKDNKPWRTLYKANLHVHPSGHGSIYGSRNLGDMANMTSLSIFKSSLVLLTPWGLRMTADSLDEGGSQSIVHVVLIAEYRLPMNMESPLDKSLADDVYS